MTLNDRKYTKDHEWLVIEGNTARIGISDHAQKELGDIVFVDLPSVGDTFKKGDAFAAVESVKAASDIYTPVSGKVIETNGALEVAPESINADPYGAFIAVMEVESIDESELMTASEYEAFIANEG